MLGEMLSKKRFYGINNIKKDKDEKYYRTAFHRDYDRIIFSNSFRALSKKTQVHPLSTNDYVHSRLTHSLEVASVGRSFGLRAGYFLKHKYNKNIKPRDIAYIIQTACLAHDIGNPPFGHAGEEVIKEWFKKHKKHKLLECLTKKEFYDFANLDGNAQSFRILSQTENNLFSGGMNLTLATLGTLVKYPYSSKECKKKNKEKFNYFQSEKNTFEFIFDKLNLKKKDNTFKRHPLSFLMEASDDICYGLLDLQDAFVLKIITLKDVEGIFIDLLGEKEKKQIYRDPKLFNSEKISKLVAISINKLAEHTMNVFENKYDIIISDSQPKNIISEFSDEKLKSGIEKAKELAKNIIFNQRRKVELELGAYNIIETLLGTLIRAAYQLHIDKDKMSFRDRRALELMGNNKPVENTSLYNKYQRVLDYIIGMTDNSAKHVANQLNGMSY